jgi:dethiobiotin synthetase/adenosylmethionine--8-amino-7-oxononanoate aminotransferase
MIEMDQSGDWQAYKDDWAEKTSLTTSRRDAGVDVWSVWSKDFIQRISNSKDVESVIALGTVLAISLHDKQAGKSQIQPLRP